MAYLNVTVKKTEIHAYLHITVVAQMEQSAIRGCMIFMHPDNCYT